MRRNILIAFTAGVTILGIILGYSQYINSQIEPDESQTVVSEKNSNEPLGEESEDDCELLTYRNETYPDFSFEYDECLYDIAESFDVDSVLRYVDQVILTSKKDDQNKVFFELRPQFGSSVALIVVPEYEKITKDLILIDDSELFSYYLLGEGADFVTGEIEEFAAYLSTNISEQRMKSYNDSFGSQSPSNAIVKITSTSADSFTINILNSLEY